MTEQTNKQTIKQTSKQKNNQTNQANKNKNQWFSICSLYFIKFKYLQPLVFLILGLSHLRTAGM